MEDNMRALQVNLEIDKDLYEDFKKIAKEKYRRSIRGQIAILIEEFVKKETEKNSASS